ncbi:MAG TPA: RodZ domain-containing protein [Candidatus Dormibacteraeota bacterium]|nr:RodZ domain-containing protein [Candidatus Dormibacteraeota bacterium]
MSKGTFGDCLKREREMREVSLEEICAATRIGTRFLEAMENEEWEKLPGGVFNRGFVRSVARYLGLDEETMLAEYDLARSHNGTPISTQPPSQSIPRSFPKWLPILFVLFLAALIAAGFHGWRVFGPRRTASSNSTSASVPDKSAPLNSNAIPVLSPTVGGNSTGSGEAAPSTGASSSRNAPNAAGTTPSTPATQNSGAPTSAGLMQLSIIAGKSAQLQVRGDGKTLYDTIINAGESRQFQALEEFNVSVSDSGGVLLELNGQTMPPLGTPGSPGKISLTRKDLKKANRGTD